MQLSNYFTYSLLYYGVVDLIKDGDCGSKTVLKED